MEAGILATLVLPVALGVIMLGLGLSLTPADFRRLLVVPRAILGSLALMFVVLPAIAFGIAKGFGLAPEMAVGLMLLAATPSGGTATLFTHLARGDTALALTLTAFSNLLGIFAITLFAQGSMGQFLGEDKRIPLQLAEILKVLAVILLPAFIGMFLRSLKPAIAARMDRPVRLLSLVFLVLVIVALVVKERAILGSSFREVGLAVLAFNVVGMALGYLLCWLLKVPRDQATAVAMGLGVRNGTLTITVAGTALGSMAMAIPAAVYSLLMFGTAALAGVLFRPKKGAPGAARHP
ncbi:MAG TPA: bile acid:sodium symporter family protein [Myxococcota bacterium]|nr:bile acid:sodium symporter family protein [Myxococcota bacterium]